MTPPATTPAREEESWLLDEASGLESPLLLEVDVESAADEAVEVPSAPDPDPDDAVAVAEELESVPVVGVTSADAVALDPLDPLDPPELLVAVALDATELVLGLALWSSLTSQTLPLVHE